MPTPIEVALGDHAHTTRLKARTQLDGTAVRFPSISPIYRAFAEMITEQRYDASEMAVVAFLQAHAAGRPLRLLPVVIAGSFHHGSIKVSPVDTPDGPADLRGRRVGVRSYAQTTGLWVRGWLREEYGVGAEEVTWVVTERSHEPTYEDPSNVELTERTLEEELRTGGVAAAIPGRDVTGYAPLLTDPRAAAQAWFQRHQLVPVNHLVAVTDEFAATAPNALAELYRALEEGIDEHDADRPVGDLSSPLRYGLDRVAPAVELAARYAVEQGLIPEVPETTELFVVPQ